MLDPGTEGREDRSGDRHASLGDSFGAGAANDGVGRSLRGVVDDACRLGGGVTTRARTISARSPLVAVVRRIEVIGLNRDVSATKHGAPECGVGPAPSHVREACGPDEPLRIRVAGAAFPRGWARADGDKMR